ncbi:hypothetical protein A33Q_1932 [Indibacter alkaliphilus LW1]|uniref:Uncharacterized protein n=1 Tax=Indibacter alkaliphilus (strain CCUG 57479 / KCTC 22604 / LW1) TaxID=1189612 RepID=S2DDN5_INDAL|nr:hypothetical protein A33Q_1932 [Indibacter alkaliphilus LW1]
MQLINKDRTIVKSRFEMPELFLNTRGVIFISKMVFHLCT